MMIRLDIALSLLCILLGSDAFYKPKNNQKYEISTPKTLDELKELLCKKKGGVVGAITGGGCDSTPRKIIIDKIFDFEDYEGMLAEPTCAYDRFDSNCPGGQVMLKSLNKCLEKDKIKTINYGKSGLEGLEVGSNKIIIGTNGGGLRGKGLKLVKSNDVEIKNLRITDINPHLFMGGSAIELQGVKNVLIEGNFFKNIGYQMILSKSGSSTQVTISNNQFDCQTTHSYYCDGTHMGLWMFTGESERIRIEHNTVLYASGRAPFVAAEKNSKTVVHLYQNSFYNILHNGAIHIVDSKSSVLAEGNIYTNVTKLVDKESKGDVYMVMSDSDEIACESNVQRRCLSNTLVNVEGGNPTNSVQVLKDIKAIADADNSLWKWWWS